MPTVNCATPKDNLKVLPCLECLSESELKQVLVVILADLMGNYTLPGDTATLIQDSACYTCFSKKQLLQLSIVIWATIAYDGEMPTLDTLRSKIACLLCANPAQIDAALAQLSCGLIDWASG